jgi:hypothetical protein
MNNLDLSLYKHMYAVVKDYQTLLRDIAQTNRMLADNHEQRLLVLTDRDIHELQIYKVTGSDISPYCVIEVKDKRTMPFIATKLVPGGELVLAVNDISGMAIEVTGRCQLIDQSERLPGFYEARKNEFTDLINQQI